VTRSVTRCVRPIEAAQKEIAIELPTAPVVMFADPVRLEQVIGNLVHNAVKFTSQGGHISVARCELQPQEVHVHVRDDGDASPPTPCRAYSTCSCRERVVRSRAGRSGIGLSLSAASSSCTAARSKRKATDQGRQRVHRDSAADGHRAGRERTEAVALQRDGPQRILIVDDNVDAATALAATLRDHHTVAMAHSGRWDRDGTLVPATGCPDRSRHARYERLRGRGAPSRRPSRVAAGRRQRYSGEESRRRRGRQIDEFVVKPFAPEASKHCSAAPR